MNDEEAQGMLSGINQSKDMNLCLICQTEKATIVNLPCRHLVLCENCEEKIKENSGNMFSKCSMCRAPVKEKLCLNFTTTPTISKQ